MMVSLNGGDYINSKNPLAREAWLSARKSEYYDLWNIKTYEDKSGLVNISFTDKKDNLLLGEIIINSDKVEIKNHFDQNFSSYFPGLKK